MNKNVVIKTVLFILINFVKKEKQKNVVDMIPCFSYEDVIFFKYLLCFVLKKVYVMYIENLTIK